MTTMTRRKNRPLQRHHPRKLDQIRVMLPRSHRHQESEGSHGPRKDPGSAPVLSEDLVLGSIPSPGTSQDLARKILPSGDQNPESARPQGKKAAQEINRRSGCGKSLHPRSGHHRGGSAPLPERGRDRRQRDQNRGSVHDLGRNLGQESALAHESALHRESAPRSVLHRASVHRRGDGNGPFPRSAQDRNPSQESGRNPGSALDQRSVLDQGSGLVPNQRNARDRSAPSPRHHQSHRGIPLLAGLRNLVAQMLIKPPLLMAFHSTLVIRHGRQRSWSHRAVA
mmetsp:Transcript_102028/g.186335  ORF Transcript_102028/g.186335 Transcript_102028/m.186335 type:complete len:282 (+) Transcript_102028:950-1795(+)